MEQWAGSKLGTKISNQAIKEINPENSLEALLWKLMLQYTGRLLRWSNSFFEGKRRRENICKKKKKGVAEDEMVREYHWLNGHELGQTPGDSKGQRTQACYSAWGCKESAKTKQLNNHNNNINNKVSSIKYTKFMGTLLLIWTYCLLYTDSAKYGLYGWIKYITRLVK